MPPGHSTSGLDSPASSPATDAGNSDPSTAAPLPYHRRSLRRSRGGVVRPARRRPCCELRESRGRGLVDDPVVATADDRRGQGRPAIGVPVGTTSPGAVPVRFGLALSTLHSMLTRFAGPLWLSRTGRTTDRRHHRTRVRPTCPRGRRHRGVRGRRCRLRRGFRSRPGPAGTGRWTVAFAYVAFSDGDRAVSGPPAPTLNDPAPLQPTITDPDRRGFGIPPVRSGSTPQQSVSPLGPWVVV
jgi:hypothetical protein